MAVNDANITNWLTDCRLVKLMPVNDDAVWAVYIQLAKAVKIGYACQWLTDSLTPKRLVDFIDVTLACEDAYPKLVEVVTVADTSDKDRVGNILLQIWKLRFGHKT